MPAGDEHDAVGGEQLDVDAGARLPASPAGAERPDPRRRDETGARGRSAAPRAASAAGIRRPTARRRRAAARAMPATSGRTASASAPRPPRHRRLSRGLLARRAGACGSRRARPATLGPLGQRGRSPAAARRRQPGRRPRRARATNGGRAISTKPCSSTPIRVAPSQSAASAIRKKLNQPWRPSTSRRKPQPTKASSSRQHQDLPHRHVRPPVQLLAEHPRPQARPAHEGQAAREAQVELAASHPQRGEHAGERHDDRPEPDDRRIRRRSQAAGDHRRPAVEPQRDAPATHVLAPGRERRRGQRLQTAVVPLVGVSADDLLPVRRRVRARPRGQLGADLVEVVHRRVVVDLRRRATRTAGRARRGNRARPGSPRGDRATAAGRRRRPWRRRPVGSARTRAR